MRSSKWFLRKLVVWLSWKLLKWISYTIIIKQRTVLKRSLKKYSCWAQHSMISPSYYKIPLYGIFQLKFILYNVHQVYQLSKKKRYYYKNVIFITHTSKENKNYLQLLFIFIVINLRNSQQEKGWMTTYPTMW
jgi:hypothetical protein